MEPQRHQGPGHPNQPPYLPQQPYYGQQPQQYPQYGPPQQWGPPQPALPPRKSKAGWIIGISLVVVIILLFAGCSALASEINGGGGSHAEKAAAMRAAVDKVPQEGWTETGRFEKKVEPGCLSIDIDCLRLEVDWVVDHEVTIDEVASRLGQNIDDLKPLYGSQSCLVNDPYDGRTTICVFEEAGGHKVTVAMTRK